MSSTDTPLLEARNLRRRHPAGHRWLLDDVSLDVFPGERLAVVGPSGSGKTLLLRALAMLDPLTGGEIRWQGDPVRGERIPAFRRRALYLHQRPSLIGETVQAALERPFALGIHRGHGFDPDRIVDLILQLGPDASFLEKRVKDLSGGELQIAALLRAVQFDPTLLLLDEPTAALDLNTAGKVEQLLLAQITAAAATRALIWITHDPGQARRVAGRVLRMEEGRVVESGES
jgi:putative ABC transport system ATP-binding protein